jgi:ABC-2 type transport system permease protein
MRGIVFKHTLRHTWLHMIMWGVGLGLMGLVVIIMTPLLDTAKFADLLEGMPPIILKAAGMPDDVQFALSPAGMIAVGFFGKFALFFVVYPIVMGLRVTANEEDAGIMDVLLSQPIARRQFMLEKLLAYVVTIMGVVLIIFGCLWLGTVIVEGAYSLSRIVESTLNLMVVLVFVLALTAFFGALIRRRQTALIILTVFVVASFFIDTLGALASGSPLGSVRLLSFFSYFDAAGVMQNGLIWSSVAALLAAAVALFAGSLWFFERRDIGL